MNIALSALSCDNATGIGRIVFSLADEFSRSGNEVTVIAQSIEALPGRVRAERCLRLPVSRGLTRILFNAQTRRFHSVNRFDVTNGFGVGRGAMITTAQSCHRAGVEIQSRVGFRRIRRKGVGLFDRVALADEQALMTSGETRLVLAVSRLVSDQLIRFYGIPSSKIEVIPNGITPERFLPLPAAEREQYRHRAECSPDDFLLLFVANEFDRKGLETVIEALAILRDLPLKVLILGDDDPEPYRDRASALGVGSKLRFLGRVPGPERWYSAADAFVLPTWYEPFGMVIVEAMAAGLPVITSATAGAVEGFRDGREGLYLRDASSADELAAAIFRIRQDDALRGILAREGSRAAGTLGWPEVAARTFRAYRRVVEGVGERP